MVKHLMILKLPSVFAIGYIIPVLIGLKSGFLKPDYAINILQLLFAIFGSVSVYIATIAYLDSISNSKRKALLEIITFFTDEVLSVNESFVKKVLSEKGNKYTFPRVKLVNPTIDYVSKKYPQEFREQLSQNEIEGIYYLRVKMINAIQKFALMVFIHDLENDTRLDCLKQSFVESVEVHAEFILSHKFFYTGGHSFEETIDLYSAWSKHVDTKTPEDRLKDFIKTQKS